jgi:anti-sigma factor RsiW
MKGVKDMECQKIQRKISAYLDGELDWGASRSIESHLNQCAACMEMVADFRRVDALVRGLPKLDMRPEFVAQLLKEAGEAGAPARRSRSDQFPFAPVLRVMTTFMDLLEERKAASTHALDEFGDFPPCSIGYIYLKLLNQPVRG